MKLLGVWLRDALILREALLVSFFLSGLVVLGGLQRWWLEPVLMGLSADDLEPLVRALARTARHPETMGLTVTLADLAQFRLALHKEMST